jgi:hypothetical protein
MCFATPYIEVRMLKLETPSDDDEDEDEDTPQRDDEHGDESEEDEEDDEEPLRARSRALRGRATARRPPRP